MSTIGSFNNKKINMQYCIFLGQPPDNSCKAFGNVSLQRWPVTTQCEPVRLLAITCLVSRPVFVSRSRAVRSVVTYNISSGRARLSTPGDLQVKLIVSWESLSSGAGQCVEVGATIPLDPVNSCERMAWGLTRAAGACTTLPKWMTHLNLVSLLFISSQTLRLSSALSLAPPAPGSPGRRPGRCLDPSLLVRPLHKSPRSASTELRNSGPGGTFELNSGGTESVENSNPPQRRTAANPLDSSPLPRYFPLANCVWRQKATNFPGTWREGGRGRRGEEERRGEVEEEGKGSKIWKAEMKEEMTEFLVLPSKSNRKAFLKKISETLQLEEIHRPALNATSARALLQFFEDESKKTDFENFRSVMTLIYEYAIPEEDGDVAKLSVSALNLAQLNRIVGVAYKNLMTSSLKQTDPEEAALQAMLSLLKMITSLAENDASCELYSASFKSGVHPFLQQPVCRLQWSVC
eukprot:106938-Hanusia_phi.AAC.3